ncbi:MAG: DUF4870 domain-containing protein [Thermoflavifilum sp.]|nr:DUF4870 domain-containing protein [Thermoflavifilum sp.]
MEAKQIHTRAAVIHLGGLLGWVIPFSFANLIGVLVLWLILRKDDPFIDDQGKEAVNFQILVSLVFLVLGILGGIMMVRHWTGIMGWNGFPFGRVYGWKMAEIGFWGICWRIVNLLNFIFCVIAAIRAGQGIAYRYPLSVRIVR